MGNLIPGPIWRMSLGMRLNTSSVSKSGGERKVEEYEVSPGPLSREDHEDEGQGEVQGAVLKVPLHPRGHWQGEGRQAEAVLTTRYVGTVEWHISYQFSRVCDMGVLLLRIFVCIVFPFYFPLTLPDLAVKELGKSAKK